MDRDDPVEAALGDQEDLYDVTTWDVRTPLDRFAVAVYTLLKTARSRLLVVAGLLLFVAQIAAAVALVAKRPALGALAGLSVLPALVVTAYFWYGDPTRREPLETLAVTFVLAILFASFAAVVNTAFSPAFEFFGTAGLAVFFFVVVAPIEETVKWLAIRAHAYKTDSFDAVIDGVVYGAVAGLGFATIENLIYILRVYVIAAPAGATTQAQAAIQTATQRAFVGPGHVIFSAFAGYYLGLARFNPDRRGPIVVKGLLIAVFIHGAYNTLVSVLPLTQASFVAFVVFYDGFWLAVLYRKLSRYKHLYRRAQGRPAEQPSE